MRQPTPGTMTREQIDMFLCVRAKAYISKGFEPEVAVSKAGADLRAMRAENLQATIAEIKATLKIAE
jgi:hypothetical protein